MARDATADGISWRGILARFVFALVLVYGTWNPTGTSFTHWVLLPLFGRGGGHTAGTVGSEGEAPIKFLVGLLLLVGWVVYIQATRRSLGLVGALLVAALTGAVVWLLSAYRIIATTGTAIGHIILIAVALLLTAGMTWSHLSRKLTGQIDTDTVE
jgi:hypothetical protein